MSKAIGELNVGDIVLIEENGQNVNYIIIHQGNPSIYYYNSACDGTWVLREDIATLMSWGDKERMVLSYAASEVHSYLNSSFLVRFSSTIQNAIKTVKIPYYPVLTYNSLTSYVGDNGLSCKAFSLSINELGDAAHREGSQLTIFANGTITRNYEANYQGEKTDWATRSQDPYNNWEDQTLIYKNKGTKAAPNTVIGVRPAFILSSSLVLPTNGTLNPSSPPTKPSFLEVPSTIKSSETFGISWGIATDDDDDLEGYILERSVDGGTWVQVYKGSLLNASDSVASGTLTVQYRVCAYDSTGETSDYLTGSLVSVINNTPPKISGSDENLGQFTTALTKTYTVTDDEGGVVAVSEKIDGVLLKSFSASLGGTNTISFSQADWAKVGNGNHVLTITATDSGGESVTRTYSFSKMETEIHLQYLTPYETERPAMMGILTVKKSIANGATFSAEVCNNGFDASPIWEDVTANVNAGGRFYLNNTTKTASKWGYNVRIKVERGTAAGDCSISSVGGYFREQEVS
ncbi:MAG: DUF6273 domain-containing protein [Eubacteriales bacterium]